MPRFYVQNFGCRATQADGAGIEKQFFERGMEAADTPSEAEVLVINSCTVTEEADRDARAAIRRAHRQNPGCQIIVTGCYAQRAPQEVAALPGVTQVIGNSHKHELVNILTTSSFVPLTNLARERVFVSDIFAHTELLAAPVFDSANQRTRPNLKVQDGCDNRCSFCVIPSVRGNSRSLPLPEVIREVNRLVETGYREVVLSGINLGRWGRDLDSLRAIASQATSGRPDSRGRLSLCDSASGIESRGSAARCYRFEDLIRAILAQTSLEKLRISSVEPMDWSDELIALMAQSARIAKHAHVPMQSASDAVLRRMHRRYRPWHYREKMEKIRAAMPAAAIGADVMVGFPGESDAEFEETRGAVEDLPFTYLHVFTYSARPGTPAAAMRNQVPIHVARERNHILRELAARKKLAFMRSFIGNTIEAITLNVHSEASRCGNSAGDNSAGMFRGDSIFTSALTDNYLKLHLSGHHEPNRWLKARVEGADGETLVGSAISGS
jgi:threonylcarbamoyladenosine tRNA methylthiotransferase MtaB